MIVYNCRITGHEMISDSYRHEECGVDGMFRVRSAFVSEGGESIAGVDDGEEEVKDTLVALCLQHPPPPHTNTTQTTRSGRKTHRGG